MLQAQETVVLEWAKKIGGTGNERPRDSFVDASGNIYLSGYFQGTVDFDPGVGIFNIASIGSSSALVTKLDADGNLVWVKTFGGAGSVAQSITADAAGNVYITGGFLGTGDFDPGAGVFNMTAATTGQADVYILKLDVNGDFVWAKGIIGGTWWDNGHEIKLDASGNIFVIGRVYYQGGPRDFDPNAGTFMVNIDWEDIFILKLDNDGNFLWVRDFGAVQESRGYSVSIDASGNVYATGYFRGTVDFDPGVGTFNLVSSGDWDVFFLKLDGNGNLIWARGMVNSAATYYSDSQHGSKIEIDATGNVYTTGRYNGTVDFDFGVGTFNLTSNGGYDIYVLKMTTNGDFIWAKSMGGSGYDEGFSISTTATGDSYVTGYFLNTVDFDPSVGTYNLTSAGGDDIFISKFDTNGNFIWARSMGGTSNDHASNIIPTSSGDLIICGDLSGTADLDPSPCVSNFTSSGGEDVFIVKLNQVAALSITSSETSGSIGETITIVGTGFSIIPGNNVVEFNNTIATVTASTATTITTTVPAGATTGPIEVTVACTTVASATFTVFTATISITTQPLDVVVCPGDIASFTTSATGTTNITYQWQYSTDGISYTDIANDSHYSGVTTTTLTVNTIGDFGEGRYQCRINGDLAAEVITADEGLFFDTPVRCNNQPPVIEAVVTSVNIGGVVTINLLSLISDPDDNLDLSTLQLVSSTSAQGASASINANQLVLNYAGILFSGTDQVEISVCDDMGECHVQILTIEVRGEIEIFNAVSPNSDGINDFFKIEFIELLEPENTVTIYNRWGSKVFEVKNYSEGNAFRGLNQNGNELPSGTYFYKIVLNSSGKTRNGFLVLKR